MSQLAIDLAATTDFRLVLLSIAISIIGSYTALDIVEQIGFSEGQTRRGWLIGSGLALGISIWSMHFTAILAHRMSTPVSYDFGIVLLSLVVAALGSGLGFWAITCQRAIEWLPLMGGGLLIGSSIAAMHYAAMAALRLAATQQYELTQTILGTAIAIVASLASLKLAFQRFHKSLPNSTAARSR